MLSLRILDNEGVIMGKVIKGESSASSYRRSRVRKDAQSPHKLASSLRELNLMLVSSDRSYSCILLANSICYLFIVSIILISVAKPSAKI